MLLGKFHCCKRPNIENTIWSSGHTAGKLCPSTPTQKLGPVLFQTFVDLNRLQSQKLLESIDPNFNKNKVPTFWHVSNDAAADVVTLLSDVVTLLSDVVTILSDFVTLLSDAVMLLSDAS